MYFDACVLLYDHKMNEPVMLYMWVEKINELQVFWYKQAKKQTNKRPDKQTNK